MAVAKPQRGDQNWDVSLNAKLDDLDLTVPGSANAVAASGTYVSRLSRFAALGLAVADNVHGTALPTAQTVAGTSRCPHTIGVDCSDLRFVYTNHSSGTSFPYADADGPNDYAIKASVEVGGTIYRLTFGGQTTGTVSPGGMLISDPLAVELAAGTVIYSRTYQSATNWYSNKKVTAFAGAGGWTVTTDLTATGSAAIADSNNSMLYVPSAIIGTPKTAGPAVLIVGDSIAHGFGDGNTFPSYSTTIPYYSGSGYLVRGLHGKVGSVNVAINGDYAAQMNLTAGHFRRGMFAAFCTHAVMEYGRNQLSNGVSLATLQAENLANCSLWSRRGLRVIATTVPPRTTTSDTWITSGGQTPHSSESVRVAYNDWLRAGAPINAGTGVAVAVGTSGALLSGQTGHPISGLWEAADQAETGRNTGLWKPANRVVTDAAMTSGSQTLTSATAAFVAGDQGRMVAVVGAAAAGAVLTAFVQTVTNSTTVTLAGQASTTVSGATAGIGIATTDGIHPTGDMASRMAVAVDTTLLT